MICTSIEQSKHLLELGLSPKTADMYYLPQVMNEGETLWPIDEGYDLDDADQPAWSLSALLEVIPRDSALYKIENTYSMHHGWTTENHTNPIDAAYEIVCWMLENGYIKKGGEQ